MPCPSEVESRYGIHHQEKTKILVYGATCTGLSDRIFRRLLYNHGFVFGTRPRHVTCSLADWHMSTVSCSFPIPLLTMRAD